MNEGGEDREACIESEQKNIPTVQHITYNFH